MKRIKLNKLMQFIAINTLLLFNCCYSTTAIRALEIIDQAYQPGGAGTYLGTATTYEGARRLAAQGGYSRFDWYSNAGDVWGYK